MKHLKIAVLFLAATLTFSCTQEREPEAQMGWSGGQKVVQVTDNSGNQFLMNYLLYQSLFAHGGYNNVVHHYYSHPTDRNYYKAGTRFTGGKPISNFKTSYARTVKVNKVYSPAKTEISRVRKSASYTRAASVFKPSTSSSYKPSTSSSSYKRSSSFSSPSRSTYRSSFRSSSFRSSRR